jgi:hypothetical protein
MPILTGPPSQLPSKPRYSSPPNLIDRQPRHHHPHSSFSSIPPSSSAHYSERPYRDDSNSTCAPSPISPLTPSSPCRSIASTRDASTHSHSSPRLISASRKDPESHFNPPPMSMSTSPPDAGYAISPRGGNLRDPIRRHRGYSTTKTTRSSDYRGSDSYGDEYIDAPAHSLS